MSEMINALQEELSWAKEFQENANRVLRLRYIIANRRTDIYNQIEKSIHGNQNIHWNELQTELSRLLEREKGILRALINSEKSVRLLQDQKNIIQQTLKDLPKRPTSQEDQLAEALALQTKALIKRFLQALKKLPKHITKITDRIEHEQEFLAEPNPTSFQKAHKNWKKEIKNDKIFLKSFSELEKIRGGIDQIQSTPVLKRFIQGATASGLYSIGHSIGRGEFEVDENWLGIAGVTLIISSLVMGFIYVYEYEKRIVDHARAEVLN